MEEARSLLAVWESFYVIVGSSGAALTGLQFVVIAMIAESRKQSTGREVAAFGTPTVVHFCTVLLVAAILSAPWRGLSGVLWRSVLVELRAYCTAQSLSDERGCRLDTRRYCRIGFGIQSYH